MVSSDQHAATLRNLADACEKVGDTELARFVRGHAELVEVMPREASGTTTFVRSDGTRVPLGEIRAHIRRSGSARGGRSDDLATAARGLARVQALCNDTGRASDREPLSTDDELDLFFDGFTWDEFTVADDDDEDHDQDQD